jgi:hypothetical protein
LGRKPQDLVTILGTDDGDKVHYPTLHIGDIDDRRLAEMPDSGEMTIRYKIRSRTHNEHKEKDGKKHTCSVTMDVTHIDPPAGKTKPKDNGARKAISEYFKDR